MKSRTSFSGICLLILVITATICSCSKDRFPQYEDIQTMVDQTVIREEIPGMIAAIMDSTGILEIAAAGVRKTGSPERITPSDHFHLGSCTKAMTSALLAILIGESKLQWETTLLEVFPELRDSIHPDYHQVTLHQLLTHRAGIERDPPGQLATYENPEVEVRRYLYMKDILKEASQIEAGTFHYSNLGYCMAGIMAERVTGQSWEALITERLFEPLGMRSAGFGPPGTSGLVDQPWGHHKEDGKWQPSQLDNPEEAGPAGRVHCSMEDWAKFLLLFLKKDHRYLLHDQFEKLIEPVGEYACGWLVLQRDWANGTALTHNGSNSMWHISVWIAPEINRAFLVGTNSFDDNTSGKNDQVMGGLISINQKNL